MLLRTLHAIHPMRAALLTSLPAVPRASSVLQNRCGFASMSDEVAKAQSARPGGETIFGKIIRNRSLST